MDIYLTATMWCAAGICAGFFYELKKKLVLTFTAGTCGIYAIGIFAGVSFPQLAQYIDGVTLWATNVGSGGLATPIGFMTGQMLGQRLIPQ